MEMVWQKRKRLSEERAREALQSAEKALQAANEAGATVRNLYITFLLLSVYIGIIIASTTDRQLLLISPVTLPLLNVQLPILGFYIFIPWLFLLVYFDLLLQLFLLSHKLRVFAQNLAVLSTEEATPLRERLINFPVVQLLANLQYDRLIQELLALVVWITVLILPLGLLLWAQLRFLPYHNVGITWGHRAAVLLDALLLLLFWPRLVSGQGALGWWISCLAFWRRGQNPVRRGTGLVLGAMMLVMLMLSLLVATVPEEPWEAWLLTYMPANWKSLSDQSQRPAAFYPTFLLLEGKHRMLSRNLELREQLLTANELSADVQHALRKGTTQQREEALQKVQGVNLQGRDLRYAILVKSLLPEAALRGAQLQGAALRWAQLQGAALRGAQLQGADLSVAQLQGASLSEAQLQGAALSGAQLQGANLWEAQLQGAALSGAQLQGAALSGAQLQGADLSEAQLQGAALSEAQLQGAALKGASIGGAGFNKVHLNLADLRDLNLSAVDRKSYKTLQSEVEESISNPKIRKNILEKLEKVIDQPGILDRIASATQCLSNAPKLLPGCLTKSQKANYFKAQANYLIEQVACSTIDAAQGILRRTLFWTDKNEANRLAATLLTVDCEPVKTARNNLSNKDKQTLESLARESQ